MQDVINYRYVKVFASLLILLFLVAFWFNEYLVDFFLSYLLLYKYTTLFIIVFLAGLCIPIPMNILLLAVGALSIEGHFNFMLALTTATIANVCGDLVALFLFRKYSHAILRDQYAEKYSFFIRLEEFFQAHTNTAIFVSRIIGIFCTPVNFLSGYMKISPLRFAFFDSLGNFAFAFLFLKLGFWVGDKWLAVSDFVSTIMGIFAVIIFFALFSVLFYNRKKE